MKKKKHSSLGQKLFLYRKFMLFDINKKIFINISYTYKKVNRYLF